MENDRCAYADPVSRRTITISERFESQRGQGRRPFEAGKLWIDSILRQPIRVVAVEIVMAMVTCEQLGDNTESDVIRAFLADFAAVRLAAYLKMKWW